MNRKERVERRKHKRYEVHNDTLVILRSSNTRIGSITDVSPGGLGFRYIGSEKSIGESAQLSILPAQNLFYLYHTPCKYVWDSKASKDHYSSITMRRCGVQFGELTPEQIRLVEYFIKNYTIEAA
ncbi:MAG: PilZ domain-containing protein [Desulfobacterales bacterium]|nr:MAG: PilZ domain-containing protein [Desulfobacterales bacterium]